MKRQTNIKGYTRKVNGKTVYVRPYSRMSGKDGASKAGAGAELQSKKSGTAMDTLSRMYSIDAYGKVTELPFDRDEISYAGADSAEVGVNPTVRPGEMSASRKKWLADLDRKLSPAEKAKYGRRVDDVPMSREEFNRALERAKSPKKAARESAPRKKRSGLSSIIEEFKGYYNKYKK